MIIKKFTKKRFYLFILTLFLLLNFGNSVFAKQITILIPFGDHARGLKSIIELYTPVEHIVDAGDTVTWINNDVVSHTVTSGKGTGLTGVLGSEELGTPDDYFSSGIITPEKSWSFKFEKIGSFTYFCEIHPWIERTILVKEPGIDASQGMRLSYTSIITLVVVGIGVSVFVFLIKKRNNRSHA